VILVALFRGAEVLWQPKNKWLAYPWIIGLFVAAALLITYREPYGAYRDGQWNPQLNANERRTRHAQADLTLDRLGKFKEDRT